MATVVMEIPFKNENCENMVVPAVALRCVQLHPGMHDRSCSAQTEWLKPTVRNFYFDVSILEGSEDLEVSRASESPLVLACYTQARGLKGKDDTNRSL